LTVVVVVAGSPFKRPSVRGRRQEAGGDKEEKGKFLIKKHEGNESPRLMSRKKKKKKIGEFYHLVLLE